MCDRDCFREQGLSCGIRSLDYLRDTTTGPPTESWTRHFHCFLPWLSLSMNTEVVFFDLLDILGVRLVALQSSLDAHGRFVHIPDTLSFHLRCSGVASFARPNGLGCGTHLDCFRCFANLF